MTKSFKCLLQQRAVDRRPRVLHGVTKIVPTLRGGEQLGGDDKNWVGTLGGDDKKRVGTLGGDDKNRVGTEQAQIKICRIATHS